MLSAALQQVAAAQTAPLDHEHIFDPAHLVQVEIELAEADWGSLRKQTRSFAKSLGRTPARSPYTYFAARVTIDGVRVDGAGVRKKGFLGSLSDSRPSLKVRFDKFGGASPVRGLDRLTLNNNQQDQSLLSQHLTYRAFRSAGLVAPRCNFAKVVVNGESLGVYSNVESVKEPFLARAFGDGTGALWEGTVADLFVDTIERFEPKTAAAADRSPLKQLAAAFAGPAVDLDEVDRLLDLDAFLGYWATESLFGFWDGYTNNQNNYFIYRNPANTKLYFIPWGADYALTERMPLPPYVVRTKAVHSQAVLPNRLYRLPAIQQRYRLVLERLLDTVWDEGDLNAEAGRVQALVSDHLAPAQSRLFGDAIAAHRRFINGRRRGLERHLRRWPTKLPDGPRRPTYSVVFGSGTGTFETRWTESDPEPVEAKSKATLSLTIRGEPVEFTKLVAHAKLGDTPSSDGSLPPVVVFTGIRRSDGETVFLVIGTSVEDFRPTGSGWVGLGGLFVEGKAGWLKPKSYRFVSGHAQFESAAMTRGAAVRGSMRVEIVEFRGGGPTSAPK